ncbi:hypothetical protein PoB_002109300 [Plakobranchus ocellatus]|uniref:Uncharacterized protein n=1 Tax=Plakobranchus ocellatus TaxID=259542 RepID=A0AAV3ZJA8_9GAST|nr:hypothetical protein PoB_002109300 [Plakobranchus ocellatus]
MNLDLIENPDLRSTSLIEQTLGKSVYISDRNRDDANKNIQQFDLIRSNHSSRALGLDCAKANYRTPVVEEDQCLSTRSSPQRGPDCRQASTLAGGQQGDERSADRLPDWAVSEWINEDVAHQQSPLFTLKPLHGVITAQRSRLNRSSGQSSEGRRLLARGITHAS